jgi:hypothetical protein
VALVVVNLYNAPRSIYILLLTAIYYIFQIVKKPGVVIKPIQYEEVDPHEKPDEPKRVIQRAVPNPKAKRTSAKQAKAIASNKRK